MGGSDGEASGVPQSGSRHPATGKDPAARPEGTAAGKTFRPLTRQEVRGVDAEAIERFGIPGIVLMENAGSGAARLIDAVAPPGAVAILCGRGNNAGDGYVIARHLQLLGRRVTIAQLLPPASLQGDAAVNWRICQAAEIPTCVLAGDDPGPLTDESLATLDALLTDSSVVVDAMLGTGAHGDPRPPLDAAIDRAGREGRCRIAIDLPSGLDCDTGQPGNPCFAADHTITFVAPKIGFTAPAAQPYLGQVHVVSIGIPDSRFRTPSTPATGLVRPWGTSRSAPAS